MPMRKVRCQCGTRIHVDDASIGQRIHCRCGRTIVVRRRPRSLASRVRLTLSTVAARARTTLGAARPARRRRSRGRPLVRAVAVLSWGYLAGAAVVALLLWTLGDQWWPATALLFSGRWGFLLPLVGLVPAAILVRRPRLLRPLTVAAVLVLGPVMGFRTGWRRLLPAGAAGARLRIVTFNADGGTEVAPRLPLLLSEWRADVVTLQECGEVLQSIVREQPGWYHHEVAQLCTMSRFPIVDAEVMDRTALEALRERSDIGGAGYVVRYTIAAPTGPFGLVNLHLETPRKGFEALMRGELRSMKGNTQLRDLESGLARSWADSARAPALIAGDFNTPVESRIFRRHWGDLDDAFERMGVGFGFTKYNGWIRVRIDHVLVGEGWRVVSAAVAPAAGSDHRPLVVELERVDPERSEGSTVRRTLRGRGE